MHNTPATVEYDGVTLKVNVTGAMPCGKRFEAILTKKGSSSEFEGKIHHDISTFTPLDTTVSP